MASTTQNLTISQGSTFSTTLTVTGSDGNARDLTNYSASGYLKYRFGDTGKLLDLSPTISTPTSGIISISIAATGTAALPVLIGYYDVEIISGTTVERVFNGKITIDPEITAQ